MASPHIRSNLPLRAGLVAVLACALLAGGCNVRQYAMNEVADVFAAGGDSIGKDNDPEFLREAMPFGLKLMEMVLAERPDHQGLAAAVSGGFTKYARVYLDMEADEVEAGTLDPRDVNLGRFARPVVDPCPPDGKPGEPGQPSRRMHTVQMLRDRARGLYLRGRDYALQGLEKAHPGFTDALRKDPRAAVRAARKKDVPLLYWAAAGWGAAISISKSDANLIADQLKVEALIDRALELDEAWDFGAIHMFLISYEPARQGAKEPLEARVKRHYERAVELTNGQMGLAFTNYAESFLLLRLEKDEFEKVLKRALAIWPEARPEWRLVNLVAHRRARWLLARMDDLF